jgi:hypothetical protein
VFGDIHQNPIGDSLPGQVGPGGAKSHRDAGLLAELEERLDFADGIRLHHRLWHEVKIGGVIGISDAVNETRMHARCGKNGREFVLKCFHV